MFNAVNGLGGGGQLDPKPSNDSNIALYSTFAVVGFFAGTITNKLGIRWTLSLGGLGYSVYISAYLCYNYTQNFGYIIFAGALLGVCAGMLWSAQGVIILSYPTEQEKGRFISWFWMIFNLGGVIGSLVSIYLAPYVQHVLPQRREANTCVGSSRPEHPRNLQRNCLKRNIHWFPHSHLRWWHAFMVPRRCQESHSQRWYPSYSDEEPNVEDRTDRTLGNPAV